MAILYMGTFTGYFFKKKPSKKYTFDPLFSLRVTMNSSTIKSPTLRIAFCIGLLFFSTSLWGQEVNYAFGPSTPLSPALNGAETQEIMPIFSSDGKTLYFVRSEENKSQGAKRKQNIWSVTKNGSNWGTPSDQLGPVNNEQDNAIAGVSADGNTLYLLNNYSRKSTEFIEVSSSQKAGETWSKPKWFQTPELFTLGEFYDFYLTPDEEVLLISMEGSKEDKNVGKEDLYVCFKSAGGNWNNPVNLGKMINTKGFEMTPFLSADKMTLFFSSNGHKGGMGDADIYMSKRQPGSWVRWSEPVNLGPEINSKALDAYFKIAPNEEVAYFSSTRNGSFDLFSTPVSKTVIAPALAAGDEGHEDLNRAGILRFGTMAATNVELKLMDESRNVLQVVKTDENGYFEFEQFVNNKNYLLAINENDTDRLKDGQLFLSNDVNSRLEFLDNNDLGLFAFKALSVDHYESFNKFQKDASDGNVVSNAKIAGVFRHGQLPAEPVELTIADESGEVLLTTTTDANGEFVIEDFVPKKNYLIAIDENNNGLAEVFEVFLSGQGENSTIVINKLDKYLFSFRALPNEDIAETANMDSLMVAVQQSLEALQKNEPPLALALQEPGTVSKNKPTPAPKPAKSASTGTASDAGPSLSFDKSSYSLGSEDANYIVLNKVIKELQENPNSKLSIEGHTCDLGTASTNLRISELRAQNTRNYLIQKGIEPSRITVRFFGEEQPLVPNMNEPSRQQNRRAVLVIQS